MSTNAARPFILDEEKMELLFPFYFAFNDRLKLIKEGKSLGKLLPSLRIRRKVNSYFLVNGKMSNSTLFTETEEGVEVILTTQFSNVKLKGTFIRQSDDDITYFFGNPILNEIDEIKKLKLDKNDFAKHDTGIDQLYRFHSNYNLLKKLTEQKKSLSQTNIRLSKNIGRLSNLFQQGMHELSEPVRNNIIYTGLLCKAGGLDKDFMHALDLLKSGSTRAKKLLDTLNIFFNAQKASKSLESSHLELIVISVQAHLKELITERNAIIRFHANLPVKIDFRHIKFILECLIENAIYFNRSKQPIIEIKCNKIGQYWSYSVEDNGIGVNKSNRNEIFDPFSRFNTKFHQGVGMNLATCKMLIELYDGDIWVEEAKGKGSRFCFTILES